MRTISNPTQEAKNITFIDGTVLVETEFETFQFYVDQINKVYTPFYSPMLYLFLEKRNVSVRLYVSMYKELCEKGFTMPFSR